MTDITPPDAGMSILGVYGLRNPTMVWLLNKRPDLLAETPKELHWSPGEPSICTRRVLRARSEG